MAREDRVGRHRDSHSRQVDGYFLGRGLALALGLLSPLFFIVLAQRDASARLQAEPAADTPAANEEPAQEPEAQAMELIAQAAGGRVGESDLLKFLDDRLQRIRAGDGPTIRDAMMVFRTLSDREARSRWKSEESEHTRLVRVEYFATALYHGGQWPEAREAFEWLLAEGGPRFRRAPLIHGLTANIARIQRDFEAADAHLDRMDATIDNDRDELRHGEAVADLHGFRTQLYLDEGLPILAYEEWKREWAALEAIDASALSATDNQLVWRRANAYMRRAEIRLELRDFERAVHELNEALVWIGERIDESPEDPRRQQKAAGLELRLGIALARCEDEDPSRPKLAEATFRKVIEGKPSQGDRIAAQLRLAYLLLNEGRLPDCRDTLEYVNERIADGSLTLLDRAMAVATETRLRMEEVRRGSAADLSEARARADEVFDDLIDDWRSQPLSHSGRGVLRSGRVRRLIASLIEVSLAIDPGPNGREAALRYVLRASQVGTLARELDSPLPDLAQIRGRLLGPGEGLLVYLYSNESWHVFAIDRDDILHDDLPPRFRMEEAQSRLVNLVLRSPGTMDATQRARRHDDLVAAAHDLFEIIVPESIRPKIDAWTGFAVTGTDLMRYIPFECLIPEHGGFLGLSKTVRYLPSLPIAATLAERRDRRVARETGDSLGGVLLTSPLPGSDAASLASELDPIRISRDDASALVDASETRPWTFLLEREATRDSLTDDLLGRAAILQFLTHGVHDPERDVTPRIVVSPDSDGSSLIDSRTLTSLALPPVLVLTVCSVGRGVARWGDPGTTDLSGAAWRSPRVESVLLPYGRIEYESTLLLTRGLQRRMASGEPLGTALLHARQAVAGADGGRYDDPYYYGLLHLQGLADRSPFPAAMIDPMRPSGTPRWPRPLIVIAAALTALILFASVFARRIRRRSRIGPAGNR